MRIFKIEHKNQKGFTLLEILIALPLATILSLTVATLMFNQYGEVLQGAARSRLRMEGEILLLS